MQSDITIPIDYAFFWTWFLIFTRFGGLLTTLPGLGTDEIPFTFRVATAMVLSIIIAMSAAAVPLPVTLIDGGLMIASEMLLGLLLGFIPMFVISATAIAGHVISASIGLGQASMIDPTLGESISVMSRVQTMIAIVVFLVIDGHHLVLKAAAITSSDVGLGLFKPGNSVAQLLLERFNQSFELGVIICGPVLITILITQFILGLITKFVPQVNIFIMSLPLTIGIGLFIVGYTLPVFSRHLAHEYADTSDVANSIMTAETSP